MSRWPDDREREDALFILGLYTGSKYVDQDQVFTERSSRVASQAVTDRLWALIEAPLPA